MKSKYLATSVAVVVLPLAVSLLRAEENPSPVPTSEEAQVPDLIVKESVVHQVDNRTLTILLGDASTQPEPPSPTAPQAPTPEQVAAKEARLAVISQTRFINIGATVYNHSTTRFEWADLSSGKKYEAWSNVDFNHLTQLSPEDKAAVAFLRFLSVSNVDTARLSEGLQREVTVPAHPALPSDGPGFVIASGDTADSTAIAGVQALHNFYGANQARLTAAYVERERLRAETAAAATVNPASQDNVMWFRPRKGSRYLQQETPQGGGSGQ